MNLCIKVTLFAFICIALVLSVIDSAKILGLFPTHSKSHLIIHSAIAEALAERGHNVTVVTTYPQTKKNLPFRYLHLNIPPISTDHISEVIKQPPFYKVAFSFIRVASKLSNASLHHPLMKKLMDEESFDLVLQGYFLNDFLFGVAAHFKCPLVLSFTMPPFSNVNDFVGNPQEFAYASAETTSSPKEPIKFLDRVKNFISVTIAREWILRPYFKLIQELYYRANFPIDKYPSLDTMMKNVSLVLTAHHFSQTTIRPNVPAMVEIGGIQIKDKPAPLPEDIQSILDDSLQNGTIYFSLGTNIHKNHLNSSKVKIIFDVLSKLPQTILCKWSDAELPLESPNIFYRKWLPQDDVLRHRSVKLFITHGGLGSVAEAQYHAIPMVGIPFYSDQYTNVQNLQNAGLGLILDYETLTEKSARNSILEVLTNQSYTDNVQRFSKLFRDRPLTAKQSAVYWVEYVLRHHGAPHLQSPAVYLNYFQLLSLDVLGFLLVISYIILRILKKIFWLLWKMLPTEKFKEE